MLDDLFQNGDGEVRLADARLSLEQQSPRDDRKGLGDPLRERDGLLECLVVGSEIVERAVLITLRDVRVSQTMMSDLLEPAVAADDAADSVVFNGLPSSVVALRAWHPGILVQKSKLKSEK